MKTKQLFFVGLIGVLAIAPLAAQSEVLEMHSEDEGIMDAVASHDDLSRFHEILTEYDGDAVNEDRSLAIFAPHDDVLEDVAVDELSEGEIAELFNRHSASGLASTTSVEWIDWFATSDGEQVSVERDDESILLNGSVAVLEAIEVSNGYLYVISETL
ncbi:MAG: hypothetical protein EA428_02130 [Spirochaetaceae bacterium]|nr:MAG: hypothetical protein EA428_02130 [Spirochaetaceae bacterium]